MLKLNNPEKSFDETSAFKTNSLTETRSTATSKTEPIQDLEDSG